MMSALSFLLSRNAEVLDFVGWLRSHNDRLTKAERVSFFGLDVYSLFSSIEAVISYLEKMVPAGAERALGGEPCPAGTGPEQRPDRPRPYAVADRFAPAPGDGGDTHRSGLTSGSHALREALHEAVADLPSEARALPVFLRGDPAEELLKASKVGVDLLVLGSRGGGPSGACSTRALPAG